MAHNLLGTVRRAGALPQASRAFDEYIQHSPITSVYIPTAPSFQAKSPPTGSGRLRTERSTAADSDSTDYPNSVILAAKFVIGGISKWIHRKFWKAGTSTIASICICSTALTPRI